MVERTGPEPDYDAKNNVLLYPHYKAVFDKFRVLVKDCVKDEADSAMLLRRVDILEEDIEGAVLRVLSAFNSMRGY
jgi:hypothetical protein